jgi:hypothetical protein
MVFRETNAVYYENHKKHKNTLCWQNARVWYVKAGGTYSDRWDLKGRRADDRETDIRFPVDARNLLSTESTSALWPTQPQI